MENNPSKKENLKAIRGCIKHWMIDICRPIKRGVDVETIHSIVWYQDGLAWTGQDGQLLKIGSRHCQLCQLHGDNCNDCPLRTVTDCACGNRYSAYNNFITSPGLVTANDIVRTLVYTYWAVMEG